MSLKKVPQIKPSRANRPRSAFDLSQKHLYTAPPGALLPVLSIDLMFHDHIRIQAQDFMRTMPMNSAAFISMRGVYEFFFVPYSQLWHQYDQFLTSMNDYRSSVVSSAAGDKALDSVPNVKLFDMYKFVRERTDKDIFGYPQSNNSCRLMDLLGYGKPITSSKTPVPLLYAGNVNLFRLLAYNKIYSDYYRNTTYEGVDVYSFNIDHKKGTFVPSADEFKKYLNLHYRNAPLDFYTNLRPTPLFTFNSDSVSSALSLSDPGAASFIADGNSAKINFTSPDVLNVSSIRSAFALDKLLSISMRAGKTYAEQIEAHFGVTVSEGRDGQVYYLGGFDSNVQVGDVTQTSGTTNPNVSEVGNAKLAGYLGKITGKGTGSGYGEIQFDAKEPGVLMCIYSVVPAMQYDCMRLDPFVAKQTRGDYFIPEFENLGMQPIVPAFVSLNRAADKSYGWQPRYSEYKTAFDINHGQFANGEPLSYWSIARARGSDTLNTFNVAALKINPHWLDSVFAVNYNGTEVTDCMFGYAHFNIEKVSDMSEDGMPRV